MGTGSYKAAEPGLWITWLKSALLGREGRELAKLSTGLALGARRLGGVEALGAQAVDRGDVQRIEIGER
ncbi:hypothetical protein HMPREF0277_0308, partial [Corynebacterium accolens ATCC 49726]